MENIAIVFGGMSYEHEISIVSAITIKKVLDRKIENISYIFVDKNREFYNIKDSDMKAKYFSSGEYKNSTKLNIKNGGFYHRGILKESKLEASLYINLIHGKDGEDAKMASLFEFFGLQYIGPRIEASTMSFNKKLTKLYANSVGVDTLPYEIVNRDKRDFKMKLPVIIKPVTLGSSIGINIVKKEEEKSYAIDSALEYDKEAIVEPFIPSIKEYNVAGTKGDDFIISKIEEPEKKEILDFEKKYLDFARDGEVKETNIDKKLKDKLIDAFKKVYGDTFEGSIPRFDFFIHEDKVILNEINSIPGSMANYLFEDFIQVIEEVSKNLSKDIKIDINYSYINKINKAKG